jgi:hypothetical protein
MDPERTLLLVTKVCTALYTNSESLYIIGEMEQIQIIDTSSPPLVTSLALFPFPFPSRRGHLPKQSYVFQTSYVLYYKNAGTRIYVKKANLQRILNRGDADFIDYKHRTGVTAYVCYAWPRDHYLF